MRICFCKRDYRLNRSWRALEKRMRGLTGSDGVEAEEGAAGRSTLASNGATCVADYSEKLQYEAVVVCSVVRDRKGEADEASNMDVVSFLSESFEAAGLKVEVLEGMDHKVFIKVSNACTAVEKIIYREFRILLE